MAVSKKLRFEVFKRDGFTCRYCGRRPPEVILEADHVVPRCEGGKDEIDNLTTACFECNRGKAGRPLGDVAPIIDEQAYLASIQSALEDQLLLKKSMAQAEKRKHTEEEITDKCLDWWEQELGIGFPLGPEKMRFFVSKIGADKMLEAIRSCAAKWNDGRMTSYGVGKYFCGVCWKMIRSAEATQ